MAAFHYGYFATQLIAGCVTSPRHVSNRCLLLCGAALMCVTGFVTPVFTLFADVIGFAIARVVAGIGQVRSTEYPPI